MQMLRKWIRNLLGFSGREVNGFLILLPLMLVAIWGMPLYHLWISDRTDDFSRETIMLDSLMAFWDSRPDSGKAEIVKLFPFNPNTATEETLQKLGFKKNLSKRITNYRQKGGQFRIKSDLLKIYGLDSTLYAHVYAYIQLPEKIEPKVEDRKSLPRHKDLPVSFDLNSADTAQLKSVHGIGPSLASRIIRFRDGLGGFVKREQLNEVYGLDSTVVNKLLAVSFIDEDFVPKKIDMNKASEKELSAHPYIKKTVANAIVAYRFQHGEFKTVEDLQKLTVLKPADIDKILPYLMVGQ
jgi:competence protein ComEA